MKIEQRHVTILREALGTYGDGIVQGIVELERRAVNAETQLGQANQKITELTKKINDLTSDSDVAVENKPQPTPLKTVSKKEEK